MKTDKKAIKLNSIFCVAGEMIPENGEDTYAYRYSDISGNSLVSVFDGCGGIGSKRYANYSGKTGAFVASRAVCGGVCAWFENDQSSPEKLPEYIQRSLAVCSGFADKTGRLIGSLGKSFPTTAAIIYSEPKSAQIDSTCFWAGDSRCYMLDTEGLHQLSDDDIDGEDALSNISGDGVLKNVICASAPFEIHSKRLSFNSPCLLICATDGCFGYLKSPMEFEQFLTGTMLSVKSISEWKTFLENSFRKFAGDDFTLCVAAYGFKSFEDMQNHFKARNAFVHTNYIVPETDLVEKWNLYKKDYYLYTQDPSAS